MMSSSINRGEDEDEDPVSKIPLMKLVDKRFYQNCGDRYLYDVETTANWLWFLHELGKVVDSKRQITFISDRYLGLLEAMPKEFPSAHHGYCLQHLQNNLRDRMKEIDNGFRDHLVSSLGDCAYELTVVMFHKKLEILKEDACRNFSHVLWRCEISYSVSKKLTSVLYNVVILYRGMRCREMTSNAAESFKNWIKEAHNLPSTQLVDTIHTQLMRQLSTRRDQANKWKETICPTFETMLLNSFNDSKSWQVSKANEDVFEVHSIPSVTVDIARRTCSCFQWQINGFPCDHAVIAIQKSRYNLITFM
ncbi:uncharacterized protein LOC114292528 [Camellia sinensis]|uniref:uncharacterized protein LOC114292528 n=1 Tax=Camellia sinensis TaxID=4442 RepID=UPI001036E1E0|nr:uncharacterized protein LOC114292528 [Camellia sinensis]